MSPRWPKCLPRIKVVWAPLLFLCIFCMYIATGSYMEWGDTIPTRYLPLSIIREYNFDLDEFPFLYQKLIPYHLQYRNGHFVSSYPVGAALLAVPFYLIPVLLGISEQSFWLLFLEKLSAASIAVLSALFLYLALRRLSSARTSIIVTGIYAFGTSTFSISSQALWQHGPSQFFLTLGLYLLIRGLQKEGFIPWSGFALSAAVVCRQTDVLLVLPVFIYLIRYHRGHLLTWVLFALPPALFFLAYHYVYFGSIFDMGHYGGAVLNLASSYWTTPFFYGLLGILVSPSKGLFVYSPILLLAFFGIYSMWRWHREPLMRYLSLGPIAVLLLYSKWHFWWGGDTYGPRLVADITPFLSLYLYPVWEAIEGSRVLKSLFVVLAVTSLIMHGIGAYAFDASWYRKSEVDANVDRLWSWRDSPLVHYGEKLFQGNLSFVRTWTSRVPTSPQAPQELSASLALQDVPDSLSASTRVALTINATNNGGAIWLFRTNDGRGYVSLGWRWLQEDRAIPYTDGRARLSRDVFPGEQARFHLKIWPPSVPGLYTLELGMVSEHMTWFSEWQIPIHVVGSCDFQGVLDKAPRLLPDPPTIGVSADKPSYRPGEVSMFNFSVANGNLSRNLVIYTVLESPDGSLRFLTTPPIHMPPNPPCSLWTRIGQLHILSKRFWLDWRIGWHLQEMAPGLYTLYAFFTEPDTAEVVAKATATFLLLPPASADTTSDALR